MHSYEPSYSLNDHYPFDVTHAMIGIIEEKSYATPEKFGEYLATGYWIDKGNIPRRLPENPGDEVTVYIDMSTAQGREFAESGLAVWSDVSGFIFREVDVQEDARITFGDSEGGRFVRYDHNQSTIDQAYVNISPNGAIDPKITFQSFIHEIGHALGLGHPSVYLGTRDYFARAQYWNDSYNETVMSYFSSTSNPTALTFLYGITPQQGDIEGLKAIYGDFQVNTGDDIYGDLILKSLSGRALPSDSFVTIHDTGGTDMIDLSARGNDQFLDLTPGARSNIDGYLTNLSLSKDTLIEHVRLGSGDDFIIGNEADNIILGGAGRDKIDGGDGVDTALYHIDAEGTKIERFSDTYQISQNAEIIDFDELKNVEIISLNGVEINIGLLSYEGEVQRDVVTYFSNIATTLHQALPGGEKIHQILQDFQSGKSKSEISKSLYEGSSLDDIFSGLTENAVIDLAYTYILGREADDLGAAFWDSALISGGITTEALLHEMIEGAYAYGNAGDISFIEARGRFAAEHAITEGIWEFGVNKDALDFISSQDDLNLRQAREALDDEQNISVLVKYDGFLDFPIF